MGRPHLLVIPFPAQGHVMPLMVLSHNLVDRGFQITFVHTEATHRRIQSALSNSSGYEEFIHLVAIPDGMEDGEDQNQFDNQIATMERVMPGHLQNLIKEINKSGGTDDRIRCVVVDEYLGWALEVAEKMSIPGAIFWPGSASFMAITLHISKMIEDGIIDEQGNPINKMFQLSPTMPIIDTDHLGWLCTGGPDMQKTTFNLMVRNNNVVKRAAYILCNSFYELEPASFPLVLKLKPIGPLHSSTTKLAHFWPEDSMCLTWLDQQPAHSVIYVAFGSLTVMNRQQFNELALGLELSGHSFLWVVRPDLTDVATNVYPDGFEERVGPRGRMVGWAPQREVLAHPAVGCFLTHCSWNSVMEGVSNGACFLCWPCFGDQILNKDYVCNVWKNGLGLNADANGIISREDIKAKVVKLFADEGIKKNAFKLKEMAMNNVNNGGGGVIQEF